MSETNDSRIKSCPLFIDSSEAVSARERNPRDRNPDVDDIPLPPDQRKDAPIRIPPDQPGIPEEDQPDPPPRGDPDVVDEPTRLVASRQYCFPKRLVVTIGNAQNGGQWYRLLTMVIVALTILAPTTIVSSSDDDKRKTSSEGQPLIWREQTSAENLDLYLGPGGGELQPDISKLTLGKQKKGGYSTKYEVTDGSGRNWIVKLGKEAQPEIAATRLLWAVGYFTEIDYYLVPSVQLGNLGLVQNARFELRPPDVERMGQWRWSKNPFEETPEFQGFKIMMALINNWDLKDSNNEILRVRTADGRYELRYIVSDLGGTFGKTGKIFTRSRNKPEDYDEERFLHSVRKKKVDIHYHGKKASLFDDIKRTDCGWLTKHLNRLTDRQIQDAFRAANYSPEDIKLLADAVRRRITTVSVVAASREEQ